ncbi:COG1361 family protein [Deinococcus puniceus]|uniref:DUF11 domain-containing protein n=1 Tax=Deinococcus puniceus TaxID=1182568 RepID=A0A172T738_9DEIO|nr:DUF11 domain-containing protein [Deinococcus puniceus]ANE42764.1 hypothetical protein SU48_02190 [Deinococcus puniceus]
MNFKRTSSLAALTALTALLAAGSVAQAQEIDTSLPLTSIGDKLMWTVGDQTLNLAVPITGRIKLDLYSPRVDQSDYRSDTYYGDEQYDANRSAVTTTFTLTDAGGKVVLRRTFTPGAHAWETLLEQDLTAGQYRLNVETKGNGKNTFAVRLTGVSADITAERLTVNVNSTDWVPAINVTTDGTVPYVVRMYDGDGASELEAQLRDEQGNITPLTVSEDLDWADLTLPEAAGRYVIELRQTGTAKQYSNTAGFSLLRAGTATPITLTRVDQTGQLRVTAELILPGSTAATSADFTLNGKTERVDGSLTRRVPVGDYALTAAPVAGATVTLDQSKLTVPKGGLAEALIQIRPEVALSLQADKTEICIGDRVTLTARASTAFAGDLPMNLTLDTPGLDIIGVNTLDGTLNAGRPGELTVIGTATVAGPLTVSARLNPWEQGKTVNLNVLPSATSLQLSREPLAAATVGDEVTVSLTVKNTAAQSVPFALTDTPGAGLVALDSTTFEGTLAAGESRTLTYRARVDAAGEATLNAQLNSPSCPAPQTVGGLLTAAPVPVPAPVVVVPEVRPAPAQVRESVVSLPYDAPTRTNELVISHLPPAGATVTPGSSRLNKQPIADPMVGPSGTLYWVIPATDAKAQRGVVAYDLAHTEVLGVMAAPSLLSRLQGNRSELLEGTFDAADLAAARPLAAPSSVTTAENAGAIKLPLAGSLIRTRDRISVVVEVPVGNLPALTINGQPVDSSTIGTNTQDGVRGVQRLTYVGVPLKPGPNVLSVNGETVTVQLVGGTAEIQVLATQMLADGSTPLRVKFRALDSFGNLASLSSVTVRTNLEPRTPDANPSESGYQVRLTDGEGVMELQPQSAPTTLKLDLLNGDDVQRQSFEVRPDASRVGVGMLSATLGLDGSLSLQDDLTYQAKGYYEGPLAGGKLYAAADKDGLSTNENTLIRYPLAGDASTESVPLQGIDPVALTYDHPAFRAQYRTTALPIDVLAVGEQFTALSAYTKTNPSVAAFAALVPRDRITDAPLTPEGTRILRLPNTDIAEGSETLVLVTLERTLQADGTQKEVGRATLIRNVDYVLDVRTGIITLARALDTVDNDLNTLRVLASYRLLNAKDGRRLAFGAQVKQTGENYSVGAAAVSLDDRVTYGVRGQYDNGTLRAGALVAYSGGVQASAEVAAKLGDDSLSARVRYQDEGYAGLNGFGVGFNASANYNARLGANLNAIADAEYHRTPTTEGGTLGARAEFRVAPFTVGGGLKYAYGDTYGLGAVGSIGYHRDPVDIDVVHTQPLFGGLGGNLDATTNITAKYRFNDKVTLGLTDAITWGAGSTNNITQSAALTLDSKLGNFNYALGYELPTASGAGNRARFGVSTALTLSERVNVGLRGSALYDLNKNETQLGAGADVNYRSDSVSATTGTDLTLNNGKFGVVVRGGITGTITPHLTLTADALAEWSADKSGLRASLGYAYRNRTFNSLGYARYLQGSLGGTQPELSTGLSAEYRQPTWAVRGGLETRTLLNDTASFTLQAQIGGTAYITDRFGVGAWGRMITQPSSGSTAYGYGLEASVRPLQGTWLTAGYNPVGFVGLPSAGTYTKQGLYLRLDLTIDENLGKEQK